MISVGEKCYISFQPSIPLMYTIPHSLSDTRAYWRPIMNLWPFLTVICVLMSR